MLNTYTTDQDEILEVCGHCENFRGFGHIINEDNYHYYCNNVRCDNYTMLHDTKEE
jgi:hypothetical protein